MKFVPYPGRHVYIELPMPRVEHASLAIVVTPGWKSTRLSGMGAMSGWWPTELLGRTPEEAEANTANFVRNQHERRLEAKNDAR